MDQNEKAKLIGARFTQLAREGKIDEATEYYKCEAVFSNDESITRSPVSDMHTPPMNELYKGIKE